MDRKERLTNLYLIVLAPLGIVAAAWAVYGFPLERLSPSLVALFVIAVFFSSYFRIQLPRTKIHLTIADAMIMLSMLVYGGEVGVIMAFLETAFTSYGLRRKGVIQKTKTAVINVLIGGVAVFATTYVVRAIFGSAVQTYEHGDGAALFWLLATMATSLFLINSVAVSAFIAVRSGKSLVSVWNDYCVNALVMYFSGAALAGFAAKALQQTNLLLFAGVTAFFGIIYFTYRRYVEDIKTTSAKAEQSERERAEQAESHIVELQHYVAELEKSSAALRESREKFRYAAYHDALTGLPNRNRFQEELELLLDACRANSGLGFAVLYLDLDRFKTINESLGHSTGDRLIRSVGERMSELRVEESLVGRFSGDEFAIILRYARDASVVTKFAEDLAQRISEPFVIDGREVFTSVSIGIAFGNAEYRKAEEVLRDADIAMYRAKELQKPCVIFDSAMHARAVTRLELETDLRYAVEKEQFELFYQPIIALEEMRLAGFEALVRWNHPRKGLVSPAEFIPLAESTGLIVPMTLQILRAASFQLVEWKLRNPGSELLTVSVNLSGKHFSHPGLLEHIASVLDESGLDPASLKLEITESAVMDSAETAIAMLKRIKATGVKLSIDDFGTGYSSLSYLHRFPIDTLKVDRSFVSTMEQGSENAEIVRTVIALAKALRLDVIAEGIESIHQLQQLRMLGCEYGQGYLFSRPLPVSEIDRLIEDSDRWQAITPSGSFGSIESYAEFVKFDFAQ